MLFPVDSIFQNPPMTTTVLPGNPFACSSAGLHQADSIARKPFCVQFSRVASGRQYRPETLLRAVQQGCIRPRESINRAVKTVQSFEDPLLCTTTLVVRGENTVEPKLVEHKRYVRKYDRSCAISQLRRRTCFIQTNEQLSRAPKV